MRTRLILLLLCISISIQSQPSPEQINENELLKYRYHRCVDIMKTLYEKILGLDHHFSSLQTQQEINQLSNPLAYPEFKKTKEVIDQQLKKKYALQLPSSMESNPFIAGAYSLFGIFLGNGNAKNKEAELQQISCILDFTMRMNSDLNIIYYETEFLKDANNSLKLECEKLFEECARVIDYDKSLSTCRSTDDWENLRVMLDEHIETIAILQAQPDLQTKGIQRKTVDLKFSIDRVIQFIHHYDQFVKQGNKHYNKFNIILNQYQSGESCSQSMPYQFEKLKADITRSIEKFNHAYNLPEIRGSELKLLMYGGVDHP